MTLLSLPTDTRTETHAHTRTRAAAHNTENPHFFIISLIIFQCSFSISFSAKYQFSVFSILFMQNYHFAPQFPIFPFSVKFAIFNIQENVINSHISFSIIITHELTLIFIYLLFSNLYSVSYTENITIIINRK